MREADLLLTKTRRAGQAAFFLALLVITLVLLALAPWETRWTENTKLVAQPRFWPVIGLGTMALFAAFHLWRMKRRGSGPLDRAEMRRWVEPLEYVLWFMGYVFLVPILGYLPVTLVFAPALTWRLGYRDKRLLWAAAIFGAATVILFKGFLSVRIPGGAVYEVLPDALRSFFILYL